MVRPYNTLSPVVFCSSILYFLLPSFVVFFVCFMFVCLLFLSPLGYLYITGRIKELLITRGGENIAPVPIEEHMLDQMKLLKNCMVIGDEQKYLTMLVTLRAEVGGCVLVTSG